MTHRIHPATQVCEACGAMVGNDGPCEPNEPGWYWVRLNRNTHWHEAGTWLAALRNEPTNDDRFGHWDVPAEDFRCFDYDIAELGPRIYPPS